MDTPYIAEVAALIGDPARANMLLALKDDGILSATELAHVAGVAPLQREYHRLQEPKLRSVKSGPSNSWRTGGSGTALTVANSTPYRGTANFITHFATKAPPCMRLFRCHDSFPLRILPNLDIRQRVRL